MSVVIMMLLIHGKEMIGQLRYTTFVKIGCYDEMLREEVDIS
jgi:hypothetical protein